MAKIDFEAIFIGRLNLPCGIRTGSFHHWIRPTLALLKNLNLPSQVTLQTFCLNPKAFPVLKVRGSFSGRRHLSSFLFICFTKKIQGMIRTLYLHKRFYCVLLRCRVRFHRVYCTTSDFTAYDLCFFITLGTKALYENAISKLTVSIKLKKGFNLFIFS